MEPSMARAMLGVEAGADPDAVRAAFRRLVRRHHPDVAGSEGTVATAQMIEAYRALTSAGPVAVARLAPPRPEAASPTTTAAPVAAALARGDTIVVAIPADAAWFAFLAMADDLGVLSYIDRGCGLLETIVEFVDYPVCSVMLSLASRTGGGTEACCVVEVLGDGAPPRAEAVAALIVERLGALVDRSPRPPDHPS